jgi:hypothetical protein
MLCFGLTLTGANRANAQLGVVFDDFEDVEDGDYVHRVPSTAEWTINSPGGQGARIEGGDLLRVPLGAGTSYIEFAEFKMTDVSIRTQARMLKEIGEPDDGLWHSISLAARLCGELGNHCRSDPDEFTYIDLWSNGEVRTQQSAAAGQRIAHTDLRPLEEDVVLQLDAFGEDIRFWVWRQGEPRPEEPIIQYTTEDDPTTDDGGVLFGTLYAHAAFRHVLLSDSPIPAPPMGDFNGDANVDLSDFMILSDNFNRTFPLSESFEKGDNNQDTLVNLQDFAEFREKFSASGMQAVPVPEPSSASLVLLSLAGLRAVCRRERMARRLVTSHR